ncbi:ACL152Wp [Eremothecium gossypii ATCC 10895]|uniref:ACL152Wp n=1 Tax=Eremothecium gossypii (strain ATCC 10895 / CBS 109.51 / FGSC 9923 / NRRL Y-1056) TaxID=284811 RepID=Q75CS1_EREGS|nr:ACL152Wp [Eremothecium gossypii ATCC 10895]AAS51076.1 ACL152Wp [Eremothecium gossypii ATCC 10895]AEY95366.1 FACL152Wp [Eremothecium gossypii FDAG1]
MLVSRLPQLAARPYAVGRGCAAGACGQRRPIMGFVRNALGLDPPASPDEPTDENRFHVWEQSPSPDLRERAARIRALARCPVTGKDIRYSCERSGIPTHHSREAWEQDEEYHRSKRWATLRKVNVYEHDLRSGRPFAEFDFPQEQGRDRMVNMLNWDLFLYTRQFYSMDTDFQLAAVTKMLSYPITIGSLLHQFSPYALEPRGPITLEGLKSLAALRYTLYPESESARAVRSKPMRIFILGARAEAQLPGHVWKQLQYLFPGSNMEIHFIGPEALYDRQRKEYVHSSTPVSKRVDGTLKLVHHTDYLHVFHEAQDFFPYDPYNDVFFCFHPGFASAEGRSSWMDKTVPALLETKCAIFVTGFHRDDMFGDFEALRASHDAEMDVLMHPTKNIFGSTKWELNDMNPHEVYQFNMYIAGFRGKRYHAIQV